MSVPNGERLMMKKMVQLGASDDEIISVLLLLTTKEQRLKMLLWLKNNSGVTVSDILKTASTIKRMKK